MTLEYKLTAALTEYDRQQSTRRGYNPNALGLYLQALHAAMEDVSNGVPVSKALKDSFCDRLLDRLLKVAESN